MSPESPRRMTHQSNPGVLRRRDSQPSIHLPRSVYLPSMKMGAEGFSKFSFGAKKCPLPGTTPPRRGLGMEDCFPLKNPMEIPPRGDKKKKKKKKKKNPP